MADGNFLSDLGTGIFGRLGELQSEQKKKDEGRRGEALQFLGSLADKIEPDSLPILMRTMADIGNFKGKVRNVWDALSGMPNRSVEDQIGTGLRDAMGLTMGPDAARNVRAGGDLARLFKPQTPFSSSPEQMVNREARLEAERGLGNRMIFRDPRAERQQDLETQYGLKFTQQENMLQERERLIRERQAKDDQRAFENRWKLNQQEADIKATQETLNLATTLAYNDNFSGPNRSHMNKAAEMISQKYGLNLDLLKARIGLAGARTAEAEANAQSIKTTGYTPVQSANIEDRRQKNFLTAQENFIASDKAVKGMEGEQTRLINQINQSINLSPGLKLRFDPAKGEIVIDQAPPNLTENELRGQVSFAARNAAKEIGEYRENLKKMEQEKGKAEGFKKSMDEYEAQRKKKKEPVRPTTPNAPLPRAGLTTERGRIRFDPQGVEYEIGHELFRNGRKHKVVGFEPDGRVIAKPVE